MLGKEGENPRMRAWTTVSACMASILLIADDAWVQNEVAAAIDDASTTVRHETDPRMATTAAGESRYDVIIIDMQVGSMGGVALIRALRDAINAGEVELTPMVLLLDRADDAFLAKRVDAAAFVTKPFTAQALRSALMGIHPAARGS